MAFLSAAAARGEAPATAPATAPAGPLPDVWKLLSDGRQREAEEALGERISANLKDEPAIFLLGVLTRSRFDVDTGDQLLKEAADLDPKSDDATAAAAMLAVDAAGTDRGKLSDTAFDSLSALAKAHPDVPAYTWLVAIACRTTQRNEEGVAAYAELGKHFQIGPVLFHQTYANMLDELHRYDESLPHRKQAVKLEPASWAWQGLGDTYRRMEDWAKAIPPYQQAVKANPNDWQSLDRLCFCANRAKNADVLLAASKQFVALRPNTPLPHLFMGDAYVLRHDDSLAADEYVAAYKLRPTDAAVRARAVRQLRKAGRNDEADALAKAGQ